MVQPELPSEEGAMDTAIAEQLKEGQKRIWASGDWPGFAPIIQESPTRQSRQ